QARTPSHDLLLPHTLHRPARHSFPTRRSSDLLRGNHQVCRDRSAATSLSYLTAGRRVSASAASARARSARPAPEARRQRPTPGPDRKSTRLNSSHVKISYAVFCLKKKKERNRS